MGKKENKNYSVGAEYCDRRSGEDIDMDAIEP